MVTTVRVPSASTPSIVCLPSGSAFSSEAERSATTPKAAPGGGGSAAMSGPGRAIVKVSVRFRTTGEPTPVDASGGPAGRAGAAATSPFGRSTLSLRVPGSSFETKMRETSSFWTVRACGSRT
jgi:hypothetical protein